jgi:hypothetical protein
MSTAASQFPAKFPANKQAIYRPQSTDISCLSSRYRAASWRSARGKGMHLTEHHRNPRRSLTAARRLVVAADREVSWGSTSARVSLAPAGAGTKRRAYLELFLRIQSRHTDADRRADPYFSPLEATASLLHIEREFLPGRSWVPAAGDGVIARPLQGAGFTVISSDLLDYGWHGSRSGVDYLKAKPLAGVEAIVTNPPFKIAQLFLEKALSEVGCIALLMRTNFLESLERMPLFCECPPSKVWISSNRLPMMHRYGWAGRRSTSNTCHSWFIWDTRREPAPDGYFNWGAIINKGTVLLLAALAEH